MSLLSKTFEKYLVSSKKKYYILHTMEEANKTMKVDLPKVNITSAKYHKLFIEET